MDELGRAFITTFSSSSLCLFLSRLFHRPAPPTKVQAELGLGGDPDPEFPRE